MAFKIKSAKMFLYVDLFSLLCFFFGIIEPTVMFRRPVEDVAFGENRTQG